jgi:hypothetical protein
MRVAKGTSVHAGKLTISPSRPGFPYYDTRTTKLTVELAADDHSLISLTGLATLGGTLDVQTAGGYRPREGEKFTLITVTGLLGPYYDGNFPSITSNVTTGLPGSQAFSGAVNSRDYRVTFLGYTAGDANGDHKINGGDLALIGGGWMQTGMGWGNCDFNGDGTVNGGDLALMGSNWMWTLPPAPPAGEPLPEPLSVAMIGAAWAALPLHRRRRP